MQHLKTDKPQTKLGILNMAVEVIMQLEQQVRGSRATLELPPDLHRALANCIDYHDDDDDLDDDKCELSLHFYLFFNFKFTINKYIVTAFYSSYLFFLSILIVVYLI